MKKCEPPSNAKNKQKTKKLAAKSTTDKKLMEKKLTKVTRNAFLNFVRHLRSQKTYKTMKDLLKEASANWKKLKDTDKKKYADEAKSAPTRETAPTFYLLGEHKLGKHLRRDLAQFKALLDKAVEQNVKTEAGGFKKRKSSKDKDSSRQKSFQKQRHSTPIKKRSRMPKIPKRPRKRPGD